MIYFKLDHSENKHSIQHDKAYSLLYSMLNELGYNDIQIKTESSGRPYTDTEGLDFSISHSGNAVAVCITSDIEKDIECTFSLPVQGQKIGVDIEVMSDKLDIESQKRIARRFLNAEVTSGEEFYRLWTRNEAYGKLTGEGVICNKAPDCTYLSFAVEFADSTYSLSIAIQ